MDDLSDELREAIKSAMSNLSVVSVRNKNTADFVEKISEKKPVYNLDPVAVGNFDDEIRNVTVNSKLPKKYCISKAGIHSVFIAIDCVKVYEKGVYFPRITSTEKISVGAERQRRYRAVKKLRAAPTEEHLWEVVLIYQKVRFKTYSGLPSPKIMSGEISAKEAAEERIWAEQTPQRCSGPRTLRTMCSMKIDFQI